jgi:hypothetical protein
MAAIAAISGNGGIDGVLGIMRNQIDPIGRTCGCAGHGAEASDALGGKTGPPLRGCRKKARIYHGIMVEAGGIEPPSEGLPATVTTRLVCEF